MKRIPQIEPVIGAEERAAVLEVMDSGFITEGQKTRELEAAIAAFFGVPYAVVVNNATLALAISFQALGIGLGDEVIVPDFTFIATANAVSLAGATPIFVDVSRETFTMDLGDIERRITPRTRAIVPVQLNGRAPGMRSLETLAAKHALAIVEDAAQAMGSAQGGRYLGTIGDAGVFSLGTTKIITAGQGGVILSRRKELHDACVRIKDHGRLTRSAEIHDVLGFNSKFTDLQAALALVQLRKLPERIARKRAIFATYRDFLAGIPGVAVPPMDPTDTVPWFVDLLCERREPLQAHLSRSGIETRRFYLPVHSQPCYAVRASSPVTEEISARGLWLPSSVNLSHGEIELICTTIRAFCESHGKVRPAGAASVG